MFPAFAGQAARSLGSWRPRSGCWRPASWRGRAGQPSGDTGWGAVLFAANCWLELAGLAIFAAHVLGRGGDLEGWSAERRDAAVLAVPAGRCAVVRDPGRAGSVVDHRARSRWRAGDPTERDAVLVFTQFFSVHRMFILGVGLRAFPTFFAAGPLSVSRVRTAFVLTQAGLVTVVAISVWRARASSMWRG
ncbi:MAG: hypothetical protein U0360_00645 [Dehalococcoidia bacterium]